MAIAIHDSGPGIAAEHLASVFDGFFTTKDSGIGIGLAICQSIITEHSGTISAANQKSIIDYNVFEGVKVNGLARYTLSRGDVVWSHGQNSQPQPGRGKLVKRKAFPAVNKALSVWKELTAPRAVTRSPEHMPIGV